jgi:hypothetical protein
MKARADCAAERRLNVPGARPAPRTVFHGLPGRQLPVEVIKRTMCDGVLRRNPDEHARGYVLGELP